MIPAFLPDRPSGLAWLVALTLPFALRRAYGISRVALASGGERRLAEAVTGGAVLTCNHPTDGDPPALWWLLRHRGVDARFMAGWDVLARQPAWVRAVLATGGCFSVRRDGLDRPALRRALHHLEAGRTLVVFPEGRTHGLGTRLLPFLPGAAQVALWAARKGGHPPPLVPMAVFYKAGDPEDALRALASMEAALGLRPAGSPYDRLRAVSFAVLAGAEREEGLTPEGGEDLDSRIANFYSRSLAALEGALGLPANEDEDSAARVFSLRLALDGHPPSPARRELLRRVLRLHKFATVADGHVASHPTPERVLDLLALLGWEAGHQSGGKPLPKPRRLAIFGVGRPLPGMAESNAQQATSSQQAATAALLDRMEKDLSEPLEGFL